LEYYVFSFFLATQKVCFCEKVVIYMMFDGFPLLKSFFLRNKGLDVLSILMENAIWTDWVL